MLTRPERLRKVVIALSNAIYDLQQIPLTAETADLLTELKTGRMTVMAMIEPSQPLKSQEATCGPS